MSQWVRLWDDMPNDPKWRVTARHAQRPVSQVLAVFNHMLINAANSTMPGVLHNWNDEVIAIAIDAETEDVTAIRKAMNGLVLDGDRLRGWEKRQPKREDSSASRTAKWRDGKKGAGDDSKHTVTHSDADVTHGDAPEEKRRETDTNSLRSLVSARAKTTNKDKSTLEEKAEPTASQISEATEKGLDEAQRKAEWKRFRDYNLARGSELADWSAAWRMWLAKLKTPPPAKPNGHAALQQVFVEEDTEQWIAWENYYRKAYGKPPPKTNRGNTMVRGWYFPTALPPLNEKLPNPF